jgi:YVTN family beta-propeller protein
MRTLRGEEMKAPRTFNTGRATLACTLGLVLLLSTAAHAQSGSGAETTAMPPPTDAKRVGHHVMLSGTRFMIWGAEPSGSMPKGLTTSPDGRWVFAANMGRRDHRTLSVYQSIPFTLEREVDFEGSAIEVTPSHDGRHLYYTNKKKAGYLDIVDLETFELLHHIRVPGFPKFILPAPDGEHVYLSLWSSDGIARVTLPAGTVETMRTKGHARIDVGGRSKNPRGMAFSPDGKTIYLANNMDRSLSFIDVATFEERKRMDLGWAPRHIAASPDGARVYISLSGQDEVAVLDTATEEVIQRVPVGHRPKSLAIARDGRFVYTANFKGSSLSIVDTETFETVELPLNVLRVSGLTVHPNDGFIYISGWCTNDVWAIQRIDPGQQPVLPLGRDRDNHPCYGCEMTSMGCPSGAELRKPRK